MKISFDYSYAQPFIKQEEITMMQPYVTLAHDMLHQKTGAGNDYTEWLDWPLNYDKEEYERVKRAAQKISSQSDVFLVIGIGGSYLGASMGQKGRPPKTNFGGLVRSKHFARCSAVNVQG